ncbi:MAG: 50S ribosomal protein L17 [bacterium]
MKKRKKGRKLNRKKDQRNALLKSLASTLILREKIKTTEAKAKELSPFIEKQISQAKIGSLSAQRILAGLLSKAIAKKLITEIAPRLKERKGGYTRIIKLGPRQSNGAKMAIIEIVK